MKRSIKSSDYDSRTHRVFLGCSGSRRWFGVHCLVLFFTFLDTLGLHANSKYSEYQVKAVFLFKFIRYVEWPDTKFADADSPIIIGLYGEDAFEGLLQRTVSGKQIHGRKVKVRIVDLEDDLAACDLLFVSDKYSSKLNRILELVRGKPVLTVGEEKRFLEKGGVINFTLKDGKVRLEINLPASQDAHLQISSRLLSVANVLK